MHNRDPYDRWEDQYLEEVCAEELSFHEFMHEHEHDELAFDAETGSNDKVLGFSLAWGPDYDQSQYFPGEALVEHNIVHLRRDFIMHYGLYDVLKMLQMDVEGMTISYDTYSAARVILWDRREGFGLKFLAKEFLLREWGSAEVLIDKYGSMEAVPLLVISEYCRQDACATFALAQLFRSMTAHHPCQDTLILAESKMNHVLAHMRHVGFGFSIPKMNGIKRQLKKSMLLLDDQIHEFIPGAFIGSNDDLARRLFAPPPDGMGINTDGLPLTPKTRRIRVSAELFEQEKHRHPVLGLIAEYKRLSKLLSTYTDSYIEAARSDGRIHSELNSFGAGTGRLSSSAPNMQNIPVSSHGVIIRKAFVAQPGWSLVSIDYKQIELVILAVMSNDTAMMEAFKRGADLHQMVADALYHHPASKEERDSVKAVNFGKIYGGGRWLFEPWAGKDEKAQKEYEDLWYSLFPNVRAFHMTYWLPKMQMRGFNETWFGRRRPLMKLPSSADGFSRASLFRELINGDIQGTAADLHKIGMVNAFEAIQSFAPLGFYWRVNMVMCVHDEVIFEVEDQHLFSVIPVLVEAMTSIDFPVRLTAEVTVGKNWYSMKPYDYSVPF